MINSFSLRESMHNSIGGVSSGLYCPFHFEKFIRVCMNPVCSHQNFLCSGCMLDNQEHCRLHKPDLKTINEFIQIAESAYKQLKNKNFKPSDISSSLVAFLNQSEIISERLTSRYYEEIRKIDIEFEFLIKEFSAICYQQRDELKNEVKQQFEQISVNYSYVLDKVRHHYRILSPEEEEEVYPNKDRILYSLESAPGLPELEAMLRKMKSEIAEGFPSSMNKSEESTRKLELRNNLQYLAETVENQIKTHMDYEYVFEKQNASQAYRAKTKTQIQEFFKGVRESIVLPTIIDTQNVNMKDELSLIRPKLKDFDVEDDSALPENSSPPFLHFFKQNTHSLYVFHVPSFAKKNERINTQKIDLNNDFKIPYEHGSVATPQGNLYLIGGQDYKNHFKDCFEFVFSTRTFLRIPSMKKARSNHAVCYMHNNIYVVGGQDSNGFLRECERYDLNSEKWFDIAPLSRGTAGATICGFQNHCLFKFGGIEAKNTYVNLIEKYDVDLNSWIPIQLQTRLTLGVDFSLGESSESAQINRNQILVFGGKFKGNCLSTCFLFDVENSEIKTSPHIKLPFEEFFRSPKSVMVRGGYLVCLSFYMRKIMCFNSQSWSVAN